MPYWVIKLAFSILGFLRLDKQFDRLFWKLRGFRPTSRWHREALEKAYTLAVHSGVAQQGDYYEFGVFKGYCLWYSQQLAKKYQLSMRFFGFDSFAGIPKPTSIDANGDFYEGQFACSKKQVLKNIRRQGADLSQITLVEGFFRTSLVPKVYKKYHMEKIAIALIDCDLYSSTNDVLAFIKPLLQKNSILLFDDWNSFGGDPKKGQRRSVREFMKRYPEITFKRGFSFGWHGQMMLVVSVATKS